MVAVSVLVATRNPGSALPAFVRSVDAQTLATSEFELVVVDSSADASAARLQQLAGRRPNVTVLTADASASVSEAERLRLALERATGEYVLVVPQQQRLTPRALQLLLESARRTGADLVLGRAATGISSGCSALSDDADGLDASAVDLAACVALVRRSLPAGHPDPGAALRDLAALAAEATTVSAVGRYACAVTDSRPRQQGTEVTLESSDYRWEDGALQLTARLRLPAPATPDLRAWLVAGQDLADVVLPATTVPGEGEGSPLTASATVDPRTADGGHPLHEGPWELRLRLVWSGHEVTVPLPPGPSRSAVLDGRPYVARAGAKGLEIDAGATRSSVIGPLARSRTAIAESARGTLVTFDYPTLHVQGDAVLDAKLLLDGFALPGHLICRDGHARLEVYASALAGSSTVAVLAGGGKPVPTGLRLRVDGKGTMTFANAPTPRRSPSGGAAPAGAPLVQRLRRRMPGALEPTVRRLSQVPALRQAYRRLINR